MSETFEVVVSDTPKGEMRVVFSGGRDEAIDYTTRVALRTEYPFCVGVRNARTGVFLSGSRLPTVALSDEEARKHFDSLFGHRPE